jgi:hypothetical protein
MCQAYGGERAFVIHMEIQEIRDKWEKHLDGSAPLTDDEIKTLCVRRIMLDEAS